MKKLFSLSAILISLTVSAVAQDQTAPRTEYSVSLSEKTLTLKPGETKQVTVTLNKSKSFVKSEAKLGLSSSLPTGVTLAYAPAEGTFDSSVASFTASADAKAGEFQVIIKTTMKNKTKGSIVKIVIESSTPKDAVSAN